ncbi:DUF7351 domain-containing protein [Haloarchaeobius iranensis]|uniref:Uncharacterized protein n=1 Tax=Haloarchaeobius iranensis TaxID=996166 RepID=A0A1G9ZU97_9EURY|nr:hypothetical protein [Haloarchaeobius iranensis]SDN24303.1 hypothetical protein SAMN05192554_12232 [Haloarchaeobius iranensis]
MSTEDDDTDERTTLPPTEAFRLLSDGTRLQTLQGLVELTAAGGYGSEPVSFSDLHAQVETDDSAHFNYHLQELQDQFVAHTEDGYRARYPARKVVRAIKAGTFTERAELADGPIDGTCPQCGECDLRASYADERLAVRCAACETDLTANDFPPGGFEERSLADVLHAFDRLVRHRVSFAADGVCPECTATMDGHVTTDIPPEWGYEALPAFDCVRCDFSVLPSFGMLLLDHPDVVSFYREQEADLREPPFWELALCVSDRFTTIESREPWRVTVRVPGENSELVASIEGADVAEVVLE